MIGDEVGVDADARALRGGDGRLQARLGAVQRFAARLAEVEAIEHVVPDREPAGVGPLRRRQPHLPVANVVNIGHAIFNRVPTRFVHLQDGGGGRIFATSRPGQC